MPSSSSKLDPYHRALCRLLHAHGVNTKKIAEFLAMKQSKPCFARIEVSPTSVWRAVCNGYVVPDDTSEDKTRFTEDYVVKIAKELSAESYGSNNKRSMKTRSQSSRQSKQPRHKRQKVSDSEYDPDDDSDREDSVVVLPTPPRPVRSSNPSFFPSTLRGASQPRRYRDRDNTTRNFRHFDAPSNSRYQAIPKNKTTPANVVRINRNTSHGRSENGGETKPKLSSSSDDDDENGDTVFSFLANLDIDLSEWYEILTNLGLGKPKQFFALAHRDEENLERMFRKVASVVPAAHRYILVEGLLKWYADTCRR